MADTQNTDAFVEFERVQKSYDGENLVVKDLNLFMPKGEFLTMLGPSGSGKTTCLMMLAGFETATHGDIRLDGTSINNISPHKRGIGMVFQNYALFPHMTVAENLAFPLEVRKIGKSDREIVSAGAITNAAGGGRREAAASSSALAGSSRELRLLLKRWSSASKLIIESRLVATFRCVLWARSPRGRPMGMVRGRWVRRSSPRVTCAAALLRNAASWRRAQNVS